MSLETPAPEAPPAEAEPSLIGGATSEPAETEPSLIGGATAEDTPPASEDEAAPEQPPETEGEQGEAAPEEYEAFTLPEGIELNEEATGEFTALAKELNLPQGEAQKLVDIAASMMQKQADSIQQRITDTVDGWRDSVMSDAEIGRSNYKETLRYAALARDQFATPELVQFLDDTQLGTNPELVRLFARVGKAIGDDTFVAAGRATPQSKPFFDHPTSTRA